MNSAWTAALAAAILGLGWSAQAAPDDEKKGPPGSEERPAPTADDARGYEKRPGVEPEDVALFVPRLVLGVPRYALKVVFFPLTETVAFLDRHAVIETVTDILYNDARTAGIVPKLTADSFFGVGLGAKAFHENLAGHGETGSISAMFGGRYAMAYQVAFAADRFGGSRLWLESRARYEIEPDLLFQGIGNPPEASTGSGLSPTGAAVETRFRQERLLSLWRLGYTVGAPGDLAKIGVTGIYNVRKFARRSRGSGPSIEAVYDTRELVGYDAGVHTLEGDVTLIVDTRDVSGATSSGSYVELFGGGVPPSGEFAFWHYGAEATAYFDLYRKTRVLVARAMLESVAGASSRIPFSDLPRLGGPNRLRGYPLDRFRDEKAALATLEYHYPIHQYVAGALYADVGKVERSYSRLFDGGSWRAGVGGGFIVRSRDKTFFSLDVAYGDSVQVYFTSDPLRAFAKRDTEL